MIRACLWWRGAESDAVDGRMQMSLSERTPVVSIFLKNREEFGNVSHDNTSVAPEDGESSFSHAVLIASSVLGLLVLLAAVGNGLLCYVVLRSIHHRHHSDLFIASLAVADFLMCTVVFPFTVTNLLFKKWRFGELFCKIWTFLDTALCAVSIYTMMAICMNICYHVRLSFVSLHKLLTDYSKLYIGGIWLWGCVIATMVVILSGVNVKYENEYASQDLDESVLMCFFEEPLPVAIVDVGVTFLLPLIYCVYIYTIVLIRLKAYSLTKGPWTRTSISPDLGPGRIPLEGLFTVTNRYTGVLVLGIKILVFFVAWAPFFTAKIATAACHSCVNGTSHSVAVFVPYVNSWISPMVYGMLNPRVHNRLLRLRWCFSKRARTARRISISVHRGTRDTIENIYRFKTRYTSREDPFPTAPHSTPASSEAYDSQDSADGPSLRHLVTALQYSEAVSDFPSARADARNVHVQDTCVDSGRTENCKISDGIDYVIVACDNLHDRFSMMTDQVVEQAKEVTSEGFVTTIMSKDDARSVSSNTDSDEHVSPVSDVGKKLVHDIKSQGDIHGKITSDSLRVTGNVHFAPWGDYFGMRRNANPASHSASRGAYPQISVTYSTSSADIIAHEATNRIRFAPEVSRITFSRSEEPDYMNPTTSAEGVDNLRISGDVDKDSVSLITSSEGEDFATSGCVDRASLAVSEGTEDASLTTDPDSLWAEHASSLSSDDTDRVSLFADHMKPISSDTSVGEDHASIGTSDDLDCVCNVLADKVSGMSQDTLNTVASSFVKSTSARPCEGLNKPIPARRSMLTKTKQMRNTSPDVNRTLPVNMNPRPLPRTCQGLLTGSNRAIVPDFSDGTHISPSRRVRRRTLVTPHKTRFLSKYIKSKYKAKVTLKHYRTYSRIQRKKAVRIPEEGPSTSFRRSVAQTGPSSDEKANPTNTTHSVAPDTYLHPLRIGFELVPSCAKPQRVQNCTETQTAQIITESPSATEHTQPPLQCVTCTASQVDSAEQHKLMRIQPPAEATFPTVSQDVFFDASDSRPGASIEEATVHRSVAHSHNEASRKVFAQSTAVSCEAGSSVDHDPQYRVKPPVRSDSSESFVSARTHISARRSLPVNKQPYVCAHDDSSDDDATTYFVPGEAASADSSSCSSAGTSIYVEVGSQRGFQEQFNSDNEAQCRESVQLVAGSGDTAPPVVTQDNNSSSQTAAVGSSGNFRHFRVDKKIRHGQDSTSFCSLTTESESREKVTGRTAAKTGDRTYSGFADVRAVSQASLQQNIMSHNEINRLALAARAHQPGISRLDFSGLENTVCSVPEKNRSHETIPTARLAFSSQASGSFSRDKPEIRKCTHEQNRQPRRVTSTEHAQSRQSVRTAYSRVVQSNSVQGSLVFKSHRQRRGQPLQRRHQKSESAITFVRFKSDTGGARLAQSELDTKRTNPTRKIKKRLSKTETLKGIVPSVGTPTKTATEKTERDDTSGNEDKKKDKPRILTSTAVTLLHSLSSLCTPLEKAEQDTDDNETSHNPSQTVGSFSPSASTTRMSGGQCRTECVNPLMLTPPSAQLPLGAEQCERNRVTDQNCCGKDTQEPSMRLSESLRRKASRITCHSTVKSQRLRTDSSDCSHTIGQEYLNNHIAEVEASSHSDTPINVKNKRHTPTSSLESLNVSKGTTSAKNHAGKDIMPIAMPVKTPRKLNGENKTNDGMPTAKPVRPIMASFPSVRPRGHSCANRVNEDKPSKSEKSSSAGNRKSLSGSESQSAGSGLECRSHESVKCADEDAKSKKEWLRRPVEHMAIVPRCSMHRSKSGVNQGLYQQLRLYYLQKHTLKQPASSETEDSARIYEQRKRFVTREAIDSSHKTIHLNEKSTTGANEKLDLCSKATSTRIRLGVNSLRTYGYGTSMAAETSGTYTDEARKDAKMVVDASSASESGVHTVSVNSVETAGKPASKHKSQTPKCPGNSGLSPRRSEQPKKAVFLSQIDHTRTGQECQFRLSQQSVHSLVSIQDDIPEVTTNHGHAAVDSGEKQTVSLTCSFESQGKERSSQTLSPKPNLKSLTPTPGTSSPDTSQGTNPKPVLTSERRQSLIFHSLTSAGKRVVSSPTTVRRRQAPSAPAGKETRSLWSGRTRRGGKPTKSAIGLFAVYANSRDSATSDKS